MGERSRFIDEKTNIVGLKVSVSIYRNGLSFHKRVHDGRDSLFPLMVQKGIVSLLGPKSGGTDMNECRTGCPHVEKFRLNEAHSQTWRGSENADLEVTVHTRPSQVLDQKWAVKLRWMERGYELK